MPLLLLCPPLLLQPLLPIIALAELTDAAALPLLLLQGAEQRWDSWWWFHTDTTPSHGLVELSLGRSQGVGERCHHHRREC
jgi:hypothetical protein